MSDTWFSVAEVLDGPDKGSFVVMRLDRETLPQATVVSTGHATEAAAEAVAVQMRETGTA